MLYSENPRPENFPAPVPSASTIAARDIELWLSQNIGPLCDVPAAQIDVAAPILDLGIESLTLFSLAGDLAAWLQRDISPTLLWECPTIQDLAAHLSQTATAAEVPAAAAAPPRSLVTIQSAGALPPLYMVHEVSGTVLSYRLLSNYLGEDQPLYGFRSPWASEEAASIPSIEQLAAFYVEELRAHQAGPYFLGGYSMGGVVAYEMARQLRAQGEQIALLLLLDAQFPGLERRDASLPQKLRIQLATARRLPHAERMRRLQRRWQHLIKRPHAHDQLAADMFQTMMNSPVSLKMQQILADYRAQPFDGSLVFLRAATQVWRVADDASGWRGVVGGEVTIHEVPGRHNTIVIEPQVPHLAAQIKRCLHSARAAL